MAIWTHERIMPEDEPDKPIDFQRLEVGRFDIEVMDLDNGRWFVEVVDQCEGEIWEGEFDSEGEAKAAGIEWLRGQLQEWLEIFG